MEEEDRLSEEISLPYLTVQRHTIVEVSSGFTRFTGYDSEELLGRDITVLYDLLKMNKNSFDFGGTESISGCFLFTKSLDAREVTVSRRPIADRDAAALIFAEKPASMLKDELPFVDKILTENMIGIGIYKAPEYILLKANQTYLDCLGEQFRDWKLACSKRLEELIPSFRGDRARDIWDGVVSRNESLYISEEKDLMPMGKDRYWDSTLTPVSENGRVKYVISMLNDVTERVFRREHIPIEQQNEESAAAYDGISAADSGNKFESGAAYMQYITDQAKYVSELKRQRDYLYNLLDRLEIPILKISYPDCKIVDFNHKAYEAIRWARQDLTISKRELSGNGILMSEVFPASAKDFNDKCIGDMVRTRETVFLDAAKMAKPASDGKYKNIIYQPILNDDDSIKEFMILMIDVTNQVLEKIELEKAMQLKDEFMYLISHEFKTPLAVISSALQTIDLLCKQQLPPIVFRFLNTIRQNTNRQLRLVNNLLDITRINAGQIKIRKSNIDIVFLTKAIVESVQLYAQQKNITLSFSSRLVRKVIGIDEEKYERILLNLLSNAIKFTQKEKAIDVTLRLRIKTGRSMVCVSVRDEGVGIPRDKQEIIFERFGQVDSALTRQAEGTGIGLSLVKLLVSALSGHIELKSDVGKGSTFKIYLPAEKVVEPKTEKSQMGSDDRLIQAAAIEFSDIYF